MTDRGCPIEGLATDVNINKVCRDFIRAKKIETFKGYEGMKGRELEKSGLTDLDLLFELEAVWLEYEKHITEKRKAYGN